jgi:hypothetical protein
MNEQPSSGPSAVWGILAGIVLIVALIGGSLYMIGDLGVQRERARAEQWSSRSQVETARAYAQTQIAQAQVEMARAHEAGSTERMQVFALTLKSMTAENQGTITLLSVGVLILGILQLVQALTRPRGGQ